MRLWSGKKRLAKKHLKEGSYFTKLLEWAVTVKPGDYIFTCEGNNRKVASVELIWENEGRWNRNRENKTYFLSEVCFTDTHGTIHYCPGGGCASGAKDPKKISDSLIRHYQAMQESDLEKWYTKNSDPHIQAVNQLKIMKDAISAKLPLVDNFGEILPEFDFVNHRTLDDKNLLNSLV